MGSNRLLSHRRTVHNWTSIRVYEGLTCLWVDQNAARWYASGFQGKQKEASARRCTLPTEATIKGERAVSAGSRVDDRCAMRRLAKSGTWERLLGVRERACRGPDAT